MNKSAACMTIIVNNMDISCIDDWLCKSELTQLCAAINDQQQVQHYNLCT